VREEIRDEEVMEVRRTRVRVKYVRCLWLWRLGFDRRERGESGISEEADEGEKRCEKGVEKRDEVRKREEAVRSEMLEDDSRVDCRLQ
jgi:hypothetical protein